MTESIHYDNQPTPQPTSPITRKGPVSRNKNIKGGVPCITGTRVPTSAMWEHHRAGYDVVQIRQQFPHLSEEQVLAAIAYEAKKARKKDPVRRQLKANGRACRNRGRDFEIYIGGRLAPFGFKRTPGSGMFGGAHSGDLRRERLERVKSCPRCLEGVDVVEPAMLLECKRMEAEQRFFRNALAQGGGSHAVVVGKKGIEPLVVLELKTFEHLLRAADYEVTR